MVKISRNDINLLKKLQNVMSVTGNEEDMKFFLLNYIKKNKNKWNKCPKVIHGREYGNMIILVFGKKPRVAALAHMDEVGFMVGHNNKLFRLGYSKEKNGDKLYGYVNNKLVTARIKKRPRKLHFTSTYDLAVGTVLSYETHWKESLNYVTNAAMDNCIGILTLLHVAKKLNNGILVFTQREEGGTLHGGLDSVAKLIYKKYNVRQILISDVTSTSSSIKHGRGPVIGIGVAETPPQHFIQKITHILDTEEVQAEIRKGGRSDFTRLLSTPYLFDMCFVGIPVSNKHSSQERIHKQDILQMFRVYSLLMRFL